MTLNSGKKEKEKEKKALEHTRSACDEACIP